MQPAFPREENDVYQGDKYRLCAFVVAGTQILNRAVSNAKPLLLLWPCGEHGIVIQYGEHEGTRRSPCVAPPAGKIPDISMLP